MRKRKKLKLQQEAEQHIAEEVLRQDDDEVLSGLYLFGEVIDRSKKTIPQTSTEVVTYEIQDKAGRRYFVDEYSPQNYLERGENIEIPVYVSVQKTERRNRLRIQCPATENQFSRNTLLDMRLRARVPHEKKPHS